MWLIIALQGLGWWVCDIVLGDGDGCGLFCGLFSDVVVFWRAGGDVLNLFLFGADGAG